MLFAVTGRHIQLACSRSRRETGEVRIRCSRRLFSWLALYTRMRGLGIVSIRAAKTDDGLVSDIEEEIKRYRVTEADSKGDTGT